jgi:dihydrolipoamide dehydrogenase
MADPGKQRALLAIAHHTRTGAAHMARRVDVAIIGAGTAGLAAMAQVRKAKRSFVLIDGGELGTTCARVGCMPSKAIIQIADDFHRRNYFPRVGIQGNDALKMDGTAALGRVRELRDIFVDRVLAGTTDEMGDEFIEGHAEFIEPDVLRVDDQIIRARRIVIATGSQPIVPSTWEPFADRILTTDTLFEQETLPGSMAVVGLGVIGLELGQALHRLGVRVTGIDQLMQVAGLQDPVVNQTAIEVLGQEFPLWLGEAAEVAEHEGRLQISSGDRSVIVDGILASLGRKPDLEGLGIDKLGIELTGDGVPRFNPHTMQVGDLPVFIAGDATGERAILHEVADEGRIAGYNAARDQIMAFRRKVPLAITFCDPNIASVGAAWNELEHDSIVVGEIRVGTVGRALIMGRNRGVLRLYADKESARLLGAAMIAPGGEHTAHLIAWSIQQGLTVFDMLKLPYYHPTIEEALQSALQDLTSKLAAKPPAVSGLELRGASEKS